MLLPSGHSGWLALRLGIGSAEIYVMAPGPPLDIKQGEIYWVDASDLDIAGSEQMKSRPYIIVSRTMINRLGRNVVGVPLSTKIAKACGHRLYLPLQHIWSQIKLQGES